MSCGLTQTICSEKCWSELTNYNPAWLNLWCANDGISGHFVSLYAGLAIFFFQRCGKCHGDKAK